MRNLLTILVALVVTVAFCASPADAAISYGTPSPSLSPTFGTLVDFDDLPSGFPVLEDDYVGVGVASITETTGAGLAFARYPGSQSQPNYIGTGIDYEIGGADQGWDGTIQIDLAFPSSQIGLGVANGRGGSETIAVYDSDGALLESHTVDPNINVYAVITRAAYEISRIELTGDYFAADDLQFDSALEVEKTLDDVNDADGDGIVEVGEPVIFTMTVTVTNVSGGTINDVKIIDGIGGDLTLIRVDSNDIPAPPGTKKKKDNEVTLGPDGYISVAWSGKTQKAHLTCSMGDLGDGESASVEIVVETDINPGQTPKDEPVHEFTSAEVGHELNQATATGMIGGVEVGGLSNVILIDIVEPN
jgi:hypothetical protein